MSKIQIEAILKNSDENHTFKGKGLKKDNQIIYLDDNIQTKITLDNIIKIERKSEYKLKLNFKKGIKLKGTYINNYGTFEVETYAKEIIQKNNELKIIYKLRVNDNEIDTFTYILKYTLDT